MQCVGVLNGPLTDSCAASLQLLRLLTDAVAVSCVFGHNHVQVDVKAIATIHQDNTSLQCRHCLCSDMQVGQKVDAVVQAVKEESHYLVVSLPSHHNALAVVPLIDYNSQQQPLSFALDERVSAVVAALPSVSTGNRLVLLAAACPGLKANDRWGGGRGERGGELLVKGVVTAVELTGLQVQLDEVSHRQVVAWQKKGVDVQRLGCGVCMLSGRMMSGSKWYRVRLLCMHQGQTVSSLCKAAHQTVTDDAVAKQYGPNVAPCTMQQPLHVWRCVDCHTQQLAKYCNTGA